MDGAGAKKRVLEVLYSCSRRVDFAPVGGANLPFNEGLLAGNYLGGVTGIGLLSRYSSLKLPIYSSIYFGKDYG